ncbi:hypothetical protein GOY17_01670 [Lysobacter soli]|uniref:hypothetical protein n=1 Tax=Lysobacter soli TaxID=453783 RepID=UPI0012EDD059|nr:hypothetical protein [Lysobacter soli]QGW63738.1 hypothetical protein GOY17_01670 [Lysobacter soli]
MPGWRLRISTFAVAILTCACAGPVGLQSPPAWRDACIEKSSAEIAASLNGVALHPNPLELAAILVERLPQHDREATYAASKLAASELGHSPSAQDIEALRPISRTAFYRAFEMQDYCSAPKEGRHVVADIFVDALVVHLYRRGDLADSTLMVDGKRADGWDEQTELMSWLIIAAANNLGSGVRPE